MSKRSSDEFLGGPTTAKQGHNKTSERDEKVDSAKKPKLAFSIGKKPLNQCKQNDKIFAKKEIVKEVVKKESLKAVFNSESEEEEEMPPEARMRMRNIGRDTPTSAGPNSFGKTKQGFCDAKKVFEKKLKDAAEKSRQGDI